MKIFLLKLRTSNWRSVEKSLMRADILVEKIGPENIKAILPRSILIIPGVGNIKDLYKEVSMYCEIGKLKDMILGRKIKVLGICLGFQFLCHKSYEDENAQCLGLFDLEVQPLYFPIKPFVGWRKLDVSSSRLDTGRIASFFDDRFFYFTHSFGVKAFGSAPPQLNTRTYDCDGVGGVIGAAYN